jgi:hypothetical protein
MDHWRNRKPGIVEKSREVGMTWVAVAMSATICLFHEGVSIGFGSRKLDLVDKLGDPDCIFWKLRKFLEYIPWQFLGSFNLDRNSAYCKTIFPDTGCTVTGEGGDQIGRGGRKSIYFVDEAAYIERPQLLEASLSATTNCRIDISSAHGTANPFYQKRMRGKIDLFTLHWRDDPRKDEEWYNKQVDELDPVTLAQEIDINYSASLEGVVIPHAWVQSAIGAAAKLNIAVTGIKRGSLDVADEGRDLNAFSARHGIELFGLASWSGKDSDTLYTSERAFLLCDELECIQFSYDADGIGAFVRGDSRLINERRGKNGELHIIVAPYRGSGGVWEPEKEMVKGRKNKDFFKNVKAQAWWNARMKFQHTFRAIQSLQSGVKMEFDADKIISISPQLPELGKLQMELSQATYKPDISGKIVIDKAPEGTRSPNLADSVIMNYAPFKRTTGLFSRVA